MNDTEVDHELTNLLRRADRPVDPGHEVLQRIHARMQARYHSDTQNDFGDATGHDIVEVRLDQVSPDDPQTSRRPVVLAIAVSVVLVLATIGIFRTNAATDRTVVSDGVNDDATVTEQPSLDFPDQLPGNVLGFEELTSYGYFWQSDQQTRRVSTEFRGGQYDPATGVFEIRIRSASGQLETALQVVETRFDLDGDLFVPLELLDPSNLGGACVGGAVEIQAAPSTSTTTATCDGEATDIAVTAIVGAAEALALLEEPVVATPVTYTLDYRDRSPRSITLWLSDRGLVRISRPDVDGTLVDLDLSIGQLSEWQEEQ